ncbi:hypothetical protein HZS47_14320 [Achromobacter xylosoxidans]|uniref:hypothetical protein n=1 Tax=Alcaligenes xylosoxydans xylosoxydans TaxID=85698 RepID=UPI0015C9A859|nr:hypothetical protein [Achromobacter xylosoxidans]NYS13997.1 hypothetical protein [Achromobacter xylosoxidans]
MNREEFLNQPDVAAFVRWLIKHLPTLPIHLKLLSSQFVPGGLDIQVQGIEAVNNQYRWKGDWSTVKGRLADLRADLKSAVRENDQVRTYGACAAVLDWGNVPRSKEFLEDLRLKGTLVSYLTIRRPFLSPTGSQRLSELTKPLFSKFNSGLAKVHALLDVDGSPIYDGRVGAAIALLYHVYRQTSKATPAGAATHRWFAWGPGIGDEGSDRIRQIRNPAMLGRGYKGTPQLRSYQSPHIWAQRQVILGWIMRSVLDQTTWFGGKTIDLAERCHAFEAGLFMMGYDLRAIVPNGWSIPDPKKKTYRRRNDDAGIPVIRGT